MNRYSTFHQEQHLRPDFDRSRFNSLHRWDLGWEILTPINIAKDQGDGEEELMRQFSPGQKALYFFWYLDAQVTNGGFIQFYLNGYRKYFEAIKSGLELICDKSMIDIVERADNAFQANRAEFDNAEVHQDTEDLYAKLESTFYPLDSAYYLAHDTTMSLVEVYIRANPDQFVRLV